MARIRGTPHGGATRDDELVPPRGAEACSHTLALHGVQVGNGLLARQYADAQRRMVGPQGLMASLLGIRSALEPYLLGPYEVQRPKELLMDTQNDLGQHLASRQEEEQGLHSMDALEPFDDVDHRCPSLELEGMQATPMDGTQPLE